MSEPGLYRNNQGSIDDEATVDFDESSHEGGRSMADDTVYEAGPSFVENDQPAERLTEMPAWLQTFAATAGESTDSRTTNEPVSSLAQPTSHSVASSESEPDETLPEWLRDTSAEPTSSVEADFDTVGDFEDFQDFGTNGADSFISEDDLPDWLRAFSEETTESPALRNGNMQAAVGLSSPATGGSAIVRVPPVENVWLSAYERQTLGPGRTLFALLASNTDATSSYDDAGTYEASDSVTVRSHQAASGVQQSADAAVTRRAATSTADTPDEKSPNTLRLVLLVVFIVIVLAFLAIAVL